MSKMKYSNVINEMTLEEKAGMTCGKSFWSSMEIERLDVVSLNMADGPHGIRKQAGNVDHLGLSKSIPATCFPTAASMANTWNPALGEAVGQYLGKEAIVQNIDILLGPGLNIKEVHYAVGTLNILVRIHIYPVKWQPAT